jgi:hypothetical protein
MLRVYNHYQWEPTKHPIDLTLATYNYSDVYLDLRCKNTDAFGRKQEKAAAMLSHFLTQSGQSQTKIE